MKPFWKTLLFVVAGLGLVVPGYSATIVVTTALDVVADDGVCSLREAILNAQTNSQFGSVDCAAGDFASNTIVFHRSLANATIVLNGSALPGGARELIIEGPIPGDAKGITLDANSASRVMVAQGQDVKTDRLILRDITLTGGFASETARGGALSISKTTLQLENVIVSNNATTGSSGRGGGIYARDARIHLIDSLVSKNQAETNNVTGGGIHVEGSELTLLRSRVLDNRTLGGTAHGGGIWAGLNPSSVGSEVRITDSILAGNATEGSSSHGGGLYASSSSVLITNSTISGNSTTTLGGGIFVGSGQLDMINSTVSGNSGGTTGGIRLHESIGLLLHSTVAFNSAPPPYARDISVFGVSNRPGALDLVHSLVVQPETGLISCSTGSAGTIASLNSLSTHEVCTGQATSPEDIHLGPLVDHGGLTRTHALFPGSVAIDAGGDCEADFDIAQDQRGEPRPGGTSSACDLGAFEVQGPPPTADLQIVKSVSPVAADVGDNVIFTLTATNLGPDQGRSVVVTDQLPAGYTFVSATADIGSYDDSSGEWFIGRLGVGISRTLTIEATVTGINDYVNTATIWGERYDPDLSNNSDQAAPDVTPHEVDLSITKLVDPVDTEVGETVTFTLTAANLGPDPATGVIVIDSLPSGYSFVSASSDVGEYDPNSGEWVIGSMANGENAVLNIEATVTTWSSYLNTATITGDQDDPDLSNNSDSAAVSVPPPPEAIIVNTLLDVVAEDGLCSLREAIINALNQDESGSSDCEVARTVRFDESLIGGTIELNGTQLPTVGEDLYIEGPVSGDPTGLTVNAMGLSRIFDMNNAADFSISDMTLTGGLTTGAGEHGGAVRLVEGSVAVFERVRLVNNVAENASGGAIYSHDSTLTVTDSEFIGNQVLAATGRGGAIDAHLRQVYLQGSTLADNHSEGNGGGINLDRSELNMANSTLSGNSSHGSGGAINIDRSTATLIHTTVAYNSASSGGSGIYGIATSDDPVELSIFNSLVVENACNFSGGAHTTVTVAGTQSTHSGCLLGSGDSVVTASEIRLMPLANYGGLTMTHGLDTGSSAINFARFCQTDYDIDQDQRGEPRPGGDSMACDVGAFEFNPGDGDTIFKSRFTGDW